MLEIKKIEKIKLRPEGNMYYRWTCPKCEGNYTYSRSINNQWGIPEDKLFCACCGILYDFEK